MTEQTDTSQLRQELAERRTAPEAIPANDLVKRNRDLFVKLWGSESEAARFVAGWKAYMDRQPNLWACDPASLVGGMAQAAALQLPFGPLDYVYLIPKQIKGNWWALFIVGYTGMVKLARDAGAQGLRATVVWSDDEWTGIRNKSGKLVYEHAAVPEHDEKANRIGVLVEWKDGERQALYCPPSRIDTALKASALSDKSRRDEDWYWRKTGIRFARPWLPQTPALALALEQDEKPAEPLDELAAVSDSESVSDGGQE